MRCARHVGLFVVFGSRIEQLDILTSRRLWHKLLVSNERMTSCTLEEKSYFDLMVMMFSVHVRVRIRRHFHCLLWWP